MKWDQTEPSQGRFNLRPANDLVQWANDNQKSIKDHALV
jgi:GH35 family endo-1,4-beta-xylanase